MKPAVRAALVSVATAAAFFSVFLAAALWAPQDQQTIRQHLIESVKSGELNQQTNLGPFGTLSIYPNIFNCLLFNMMLAPASGPLIDAVSNRMAAHDGAGNDARVPPVPDCQALVRALPELGGAGANFAEYDRYILGMRVLGRVLLSTTSVRALRHILLGTAYALLGLIGIVALYRFSRATNNVFERARAAGYVAIAACLALFYGIHYFGATLYFGPMDCVQYAFILASLVWPLEDLRPARLAIYAASYGSLIAIFEFMTGGIPLALALLPLLLALGFRGDKSAYFEKLIQLWGCFCLAVIASFAIKNIFAVAYLGRPNTFVPALLYRTYGSFHASPEASYSISYLWEIYHINSALIAWSSRWLGTGLVIAALGFVSVVTWQNRKAEWSANRPVQLACWLSLAALTTWVAVFLNHSILHPFFMVRLLVIPIIAGAVLIVTEMTFRPARRPARSHPSAA